MRLLLLVSSTFVLLQARSTPVQDKIRRILDFMQTVRGNGELAISTPTGLYPVNQITAETIPDIFGFHDALKRELAEAETEAKARGKTFLPERFSADNEISLARRENKQTAVPAPQTPQLSTNRGAVRGRRPSLPVHPSDYNAANTAPSFGGVFSPPFDNEASVALDANPGTEKEAIGFHAANLKGAWSLPPSNIQVEPAPEFGEDISIGL